MNRSVTHALLPTALLLAGAIAIPAFAAEPVVLPSRDAALLVPDLPPALRDPDPGNRTLNAPVSAPVTPKADSGRLGDEASFCNVFVNESDRERSGTTGFC